MPDIIPEKISDSSDLTPSKKKVIILAILLILIPTLRGCTEFQFGMVGPIHSLRGYAPGDIGFPNEFISTFNFEFLITNVIVVSILAYLFFVWLKKQHEEGVNRINSGLNTLIIYLLIYYVALFPYYFTAFYGLENAAVLMMRTLLPFASPGALCLWLTPICKGFLKELKPLIPLLLGLLVMFYIGYRYHDNNKKLKIIFLLMLIIFWSLLGILINSILFSAL